MASLPLDVVLEIAARSDPVTLVRCAATCRAVRRRVADPTFWRRLRLRHADRFVPSLLRGHLIMGYKEKSISSIEMQFVDTTTADATARPLTTVEGFLPRTDGKTSRRYEHVASHDGLLLVRSSNYQSPYDPDLCVCNPATGRSRALPAEPKFGDEAAPTLWQPYVLLTGDGESDGAGGVGRPFQVLKTNLAVSPNHRFLQIHIFSSETGMWGPYIKIRTPHLHGSRLLQRGGNPLVVDGAVHWLCLTDKTSYILKLQVREAKVTITALPATFPRPATSMEKRTLYNYHIDYLLVAASPCGSLMVLVADRMKISAWMQEKQTAKWKQKAQDVVKNDDIPSEKTHSTFDIRLLWFAERSGIVLVYLICYGFFWLDLRSMEIVRQFKYRAAVYSANDHPYEMHLSSWTPTFSAAI
ncbi:hypothetical protein EJB05_10698, partial [Eragrostis curvula]